MNSLFHFLILLKQKLLPLKNSLNHRIIFKSGLKYYNVESDFFHFKNLVGELAFASNDTILEKNPNKFAIGKDIFLDRKNTMLLSFSDTTITLFDSNNVYDTTGFTFVKSLNTCNGFEVCLTVDSLEYAFLFDTGSKDFLVMPQYRRHRKCLIVDGNVKCDYFYIQYEKHKKENDILVTSCKQRNAIDTLIVQQTNAIKIGNLDSIVGKIIYTKKTMQPTIGMPFISHFDWIIDINNGKMYAKQTKNSVR